MDWYRELSAVAIDVKEKSGEFRSKISKTFTKIHVAILIVLLASNQSKFGSGNFPYEFCHKRKFITKFRLNLIL